MSVSTEEIIAINSLLLQREAAFAQVHLIESRIEGLLGEAYPFEAPEVHVPSSVKRKSKKAERAKAAPKAALKIRRLNEDEVAYRITWRNKDELTTTEVTNPRSLTPLLENMLPGTELERIETVHRDGTTQQLN